MSHSYIPNNSLRLKIENSCNLKCVFCHAEGSRHSGRMSINHIYKILDFADQYGYTKIHLTGGEPTLHPHIHEIVQLCTLQEKNCALTSNGQCSPEVIDKLTFAGLQSINFSLPTIRPSVWSKLQNNTSVETSTKQISNVLNSIAFSIQKKLRTKVNIIVSDTTGDAIEVIEFLKYTPVEIRLLDTLGNNKAIICIEEILSYYSAQLLDEIVTLGSSQVKRIYDSKKGRLVVKAIRPYRLSSICKDCKSRCNEGFYGIRFEACKGKIFARFCIHRESVRVTKELSRLSKSNQFHEIYCESGISMINRKEIG